MWRHKTSGHLKKEDEPAEAELRRMDFGWVSEEKGGGVWVVEWNEEDEVSERMAGWEWR